MVTTCGRKHTTQFSESTTEARFSGPVWSFKPHKGTVPRCTVRLGLRDLTLMKTTKQSQQKGEETSVNKSRKSHRSTTACENRVRSLESVYSGKSRQSLVHRDWSDPCVLATGLASGRSIRNVSGHTDLATIKSIQPRRNTSASNKRTPIQSLKDLLAAVPRCSMESPGGQ